MTPAPTLHWTESDLPRTALWRSERGAPPPKRVVLADDTWSHSGQSAGVQVLASGGDDRVQGGTGDNGVTHENATTFIAGCTNFMRVSRHKGLGRRMDAAWAAAYARPAFALVTLGTNRSAA